MNGIEEVMILLAEDNPGHARLIEKNLIRCNITNQIVTVTDGQQALDYLFHQGEYANELTSLPLLVLLDLNMPGVDGYQVLEKMKSHPDTKSIPVIILTTTDDGHDVSRCYKLGCSVYISKPISYEKLADAIKRLGLFLSVVTIPGTV